MIISQSEKKLMASYMHDVIKSAIDAKECFYTIIYKKMKPEQEARQSEIDVCSCLKNYNTVVNTLFDSISFIRIITDNHVFFNEDLEKDIMRNFFFLRYDSEEYASWFPKDYEDWREENDYL